MRLRNKVKAKNKKINESWIKKSLNVRQWLVITRAWRKRQGSSNIAPGRVHTKNGKYICSYRYNNKRDEVHEYKEEEKFAACKREISYVPSNARV